MIHKNLTTIQKEASTVIHKNLTTNQGGRTYQKGDLMRKVVLPVFLLFLFVAAFPFKGYSAEPTYPIFTDVKTTRERTVSPVTIPDAPEINIATGRPIRRIGIQSLEVRETVSTTARFYRTAPQWAHTTRPKRF